MIDISTELFEGLTLATESEKGAVWNVRPFQCVSLFEMLQVWAYPFYEMTYHLDTYMRELKYEIDKRGKDEKTKYINEQDKERAGVILDLVQSRCEPFGMEMTLRRVFSAHNAVVCRPPHTLEKLLWEIDEIESAIRSHLMRTVWMHIPPDKAEFHQECRKNRSLPPLLDERTGRRFPKASKEITEAGNCYAVGNNTACVFHLMRAAEQGMRALALKLNVSFTKNPQTPIDLRTWGDVITAITNVINSKPNAKTPKEAKELELYNKAANQLQIFKDAWRDVVMHYRNKEYLEGETKDLMNSVCAFIQELSTILREK